MPSALDPQLKAHQEWLGYLQPVGLVVAPAALVEAGWVLAQGGKQLLAEQERYREALETLQPPELDSDTDDSGADRSDDSGASQGFRSLDDLLVNHLGWEPYRLDRSPEAISTHSRELPELGTTLAPTAVVNAEGGGAPLLLVVELPLGSGLDQKGQPAQAGAEPWRATPQERLERLLRETGVETGLLFNGRQLRLVVAPRGESSGHLTFPLADLAAVSGRLMFAGLQLLLGVSPVFLNPEGYRLQDVLRKSRSFQAVVSNALADQVLAALWELLRGFQRADGLCQRTGEGEAEQQDGQPPTHKLPDHDPQQLYGGLITALMRLVFLLYAEDEALMPADAVYEQNYKVSGLFEKLQRDAAELPDTMEQRYGAWSGLMSLCRLVFDGGGATRDYLPARHGQLFDPDVYPWLETPWISDGVVLSVLRNLLIVKGERISYRALDVEQIGSVYEGIMGFRVERITGRCIGIKSKPQGARKQLTTAVDLEVLLSKPTNQRKGWLETLANTSLPATAARALANASTEAELLAALAPRINRELFDGPQPAGSLVFQPTEERRRSGSHYTPRSLTRPIVEEALRPWRERCDGQPSAEQILALKICDPAMGSGAFLVESCRYLAELLTVAWSREGLPKALQEGGPAFGEEPLIYARRLIAQTCLYGVDKNPFAVNLARLSLWLVSLSKDAPFTFVDHALKCGDSLVGVTKQEIDKALRSASRQRELWEAELRSIGHTQSHSLELFHYDSRTDADDDIKRQALQDLESSTAYERTVGDLLVAAFFNGTSTTDRKNKAKIYLAATVNCETAAELEEVMAEPLDKLRDGEKGVTPLHWELAFPDAFQRANPGFDVFVGNPPFAGNSTLVQAYADGILAWFKQLHPESGGQCDLVAHFFRRCFNLLRVGGSMGLIATNTIAQGDTRSSGLRWICLNGGMIYATQKRFKWPGAAAVVVSVVHLIKGAYSGLKLLDRQPVEQITAFLLCNGGHEDPKPLALNKGKSFKGSMLYGQGFTFDDSGAADDDTPGVPSPIATMECLIAEDSQNAKAILPYIGGEEVNTSPTHSHRRFAINFGERDELTCRQKWPSLMRVVERKVRPERNLLKNNPDGLRLKTRWWIHGRSRPEMYEAIANCERVLVACRHQPNWQITFLRPDLIFSEALTVLAIQDGSWFATLQSALHESWSRFVGSSMKDDMRYTHNDCFETFPFPKALIDFSAGDSEHYLKLKKLESIGKRYHEFRSYLMVINNEGLTKTYNRFHDPEETSCCLLNLRQLHNEMDQAVLNAYGWSDVPNTCGYGLDYLDVEEDAQLPEDLQDRIASGDLFFEQADAACAFQAQLRAYGAVRPNKKLPWRHRWPDAVRDDVLARLLALNAERYAEEVAQGLHG